MARKRAKSNKKTLQEVKRRIQKQAGGMGPLGSRGRELPPQELANIARFKLPDSSCSGGITGISGT